MKTLTHFLDTPKRSEISALLKPLPISSTTCDSRRLNNIGRSSLTAFRLLRFLFIVQRLSRWLIPRGARHERPRCRLYHIGCGDNNTLRVRSRPLTSTHHSRAWVVGWVTTPQAKPGSEAISSS